MLTGIMDITKCGYVAKCSQQLSVFIAFVVLAHTPMRKRGSTFLAFYKFIYDKRNKNIPDGIKRFFNLDLAFVNIPK